nr:WYL domain-containing protein [uncultured Oscillibacter sp.]
MQTEVVDEEHFQAAVNAASSPPFFAWVFAFGGKIRIIEPEEVATKIEETAGWLY